ncbi:ArdC-like ssDNA-binding domain-containing protein [Mesorhizobium sp.]|uniref:ArdC-like ssDNA-binding domain-containing protein n=1 Tax=Mesorhizobium sp. TaxID=1871066 RepID=UPI000FE39FF4|nr:ArdC-like ssDNA-binding domain-containing protein [Mesorhizobium sp.]RWA97294.1 MAG: DUF1738 domain-containing protein [Mesorhizobium sp.]RWK58647.1 MAG: DUF1738 domain-containing protein [Mesorhizobium sp.]RWM43113.1 MAG: DUF1738 domain-containing protein [Mesorhizobium sp.]RWM43925.1 MAG: DUF1738 domain-containing protein [Mesorhizobium sp.]RWM75072.1 MAG: DUF1738 domain-containing protein [Mesorhizobium sp.]
MHARQRTASGEIGEGGRSGDGLYQEFPHRIIADLEFGTVPWVKPWGRSKAGLGQPRILQGRQPPVLHEKKRQLSQHG